MSDYRGLHLLKLYKDQQEEEDRFLEVDCIIEEYQDNYISRPGFIQESKKTHMKRFLDRNKYDPKTGTYETDILDENGKKMRVPLEISPTEKSHFTATHNTKTGQVTPNKIVINRKDAKSKNWDSQFTLKMESYYMEADEDEDNESNDDEKDIEKDNKNSDKEDNKSSTDEKESSNVGDDDDIDLSEFGNHGGDDLPNNEYDKDEVDKLNQLIASEAQAISEYMEAAKTSHEDILQRLYSDIGDEERFHLEQLIFAKSELTGETYKPSDPAVKKEYEELLELGMDEESAMATAIDKTGLRKQVEEADGDIEKDTKKLEEEIEMVESAIFNVDLLMTIMEQAYDDPDPSLLNQIHVFTEEYYQEALMNTADMSDELKKPFNPFVAMYKLLRAILSAFATVISNYKNWLNKMKQKRVALHNWVQNHGIQGLFENGISMYLWNDTTQSFDFNDMAYYINALFIIAKGCGEDAFTTKTGFRNKDVYMKCMPPFVRLTPPIVIQAQQQLPTRQEALNKVQNVNFMKTKIIINDKNENTIQELFFGYTNEAFQKFNPESKNPIELKSKNIYNTIQWLLDVANYYCKATGEVIKGFQEIGEGSADRDSIFYSNRNLYKEDFRQLQIVVKNYNTLIRVLSSDIRTLMYIENGTLARTNQQEADNQNITERDYKHPHPIS